MKTSFISTISINTTMRNSIAAAQAEMNKALQESVSGKHADLGVTLGAVTARALDLSREIGRLESLQTTASTAKSRLENAELTLENINTHALNIQSAIITLGQSSDPTSLATARKAATTALDAFTDAVNTSVAGEYIFAGINTDVKPLEDYLDATSPARTAFDTELNHFLSLNGIGNRDAMTEAQMQTFLDDLSAKFAGTAPLTSPPHDASVAGQDLWTTYFSSASDQNVKSRISPTEVVESSTNANSAGMRNFALASIIAVEFLQPEMDEKARLVAAGRVTETIALAMNGVDSINQQRTSVGIATERVTKTGARLRTQQDILSTSLGNLQKVDPEEAAIRLNNMKTLLETAYAVTAKIQQLSLVNYL